MIVVIKFTTICCIGTISFLVKLRTVNEYVRGYSRSADMATEMELKENVDALRHVKVGKIVAPWC